MKYKIALLMVAAGLSVAACSKQDAGDNAALANADVTANLGDAGELSGNDATFADNAVLPADEGNAALPEAGNAAAPAANAL